MRTVYYIAICEFFVYVLLPIIIVGGVLSQPGSHMPFDREEGIETDHKREG